MGKQVEHNTAPNLAQTADILYVAAEAHLACFRPVLRTGMGIRSLTWLGPVALLWMTGYAQFNRSGPLMAYALFLWLPACFVQTVFLRNPHVHSRYPGFPVLGRLFGECAALVLEMILLFTVGLYLYTLNQPLGTFVFLGGFASFIKQSFDRARGRMHAIRMRDDMLEAQWRAGMYR